MKHLLMSMLLLLAFTACSSEKKEEDKSQTNLEAVAIPIDSLEAGDDSESLESITNKNTQEIDSLLNGI